MAKGAVTVKEVFTDAQVDTIIATPKNDQAFVVWNCIIRSSNTENVTPPTVVKFAGGQVIKEITGRGGTGASNFFKEGDLNESITITCPANTTVIMFLDEVPG